MRMALLEVNNLCISFGGLRAVDDFNITIEKGELYGLIGPNGAGKSTTINILTTILEKTSGNAYICGHELGKEDDEIRKVNGIVFQNSVLDKKLSVKDNLLTRGSYYGLSRKEVLKRLEPFSERFEMKEIWDRKYEKLSATRDQT